MFLLINTQLFDYILLKVSYFCLFSAIFHHYSRSKDKYIFQTSYFFLFFFHYFQNSPLITVFFPEEIKLKTKSCVGIFEILQTGLKAQVLPQQDIGTKQEFVPRVFGHHPPLREK